MRTSPRRYYNISQTILQRFSNNLQLTEEQFWTRYFQSKLFNAHRASIRSSAAQHVVKDDPIFDKYLEKDDDRACIIAHVSSTALTLSRA